jgi:hypothetical protein
MASAHTYDWSTHGTLLRRRRSGISSIEAIVAFTLLSTTLTLSLPLVVHHQRLLVSARHYRVALDELSNQLDRLAALPAADVRSELARFSPSPFLAKNLPGAVLTGELQSADIGQRLTLHLTWSDLPRSPTTVALAAWMLPSAETSAGATKEGGAP